MANIRCTDESPTGDCDDSHQKWIYAASAFLIIRVLIIGMKLPAVRQVSTPALLDSEKLGEINFQKRKVKDKGAFLMVACLLDFICLPERISKNKIIFLSS